MTGPFDPTSIAKAVHATLDEAFATIPTGKSRVLMIDGTWDQSEGGKARVLIAQRMDDGWNIALETSIDKPHGLGARVATMKSWD